MISNIENKYLLITITSSNNGKIVFLSFYPPLTYTKLRTNSNQLLIVDKTTERRTSQMNLDVKIY